MTVKRELLAPDRSIEKRRPMEYDEPTLLADYVWDYCRELFTDFERSVWRAERLREQRGMGSRESLLRLYPNIDTRLTLEEVTRVVDVVFGDLADFRESVRNRVVNEHPEVVKRCPHCHRLLRTPKAQQCRWCFRGWHKASE